MGLARTSHGRIGRFSGLVCLAVAAQLLACASAWAQEAVRGTQVRMASGVGFSTFDPVLATPPTVDYLRPAYDTLVLRRGIDRFEPGLATAWAFSDGNRKLVLTLREGVRFTDGTPFDAAAVKLNLERGREAKGSPWAAVYRGIERINVLGPYRIELQLARPNAALIEYFANNPGMMVSPLALKDAASLARQPAGTGGWRLDPKRTIHGDRYVFERHEGYWNPKAQGVDTVVIQQMTEATARINALRSGQVDVVTVPQDQAAALEKLGFRISAANKVYYLLSVWDSRGTVVKPLANPKVRQAVSLAINRDAVLKAIFGGRGTAGLNFFPAGTGGYSEALGKLRAYDPAMARKLLAEVGYPDGFQVDAVVVANNARFASAVAGELAKVGIRVNLKTMPDTGSYQAAVSHRQSPLGIFAHQTAMPATLYASLLSAEGRYNPFGVEHADLDALARIAAESQEPKASQQYGLLFERMVAEDAVVFPVVHVELLTASARGVDVGPITFASAGLPDPRSVSVTRK